jgi:hypothetical protein
MPILVLNRFDIHKIQFTIENALIRSSGPVIVLIGEKETAKKVLIKDIIYHHNNIPFGTIISRSNNNLLSTNCHIGYNNVIVENVIQIQRIVMSRNKTNLIKQDPRTFIVFDDCLNDEWSREKTMRMVLMNGICFRIALIISMQHPLVIPPILRPNIDYIFIFMEPNTRNRKKIYNNYAGMFPTFELFCQFMDKLDHNECLVIDYNVKSNKLEDQLFWYKVKEYNYEEIKEKTLELNKEYLKYYWHPNRIDKWNWELEED